MKKLSIYSAVRTKIIIRYVCALAVVLVLGAALTTNLFRNSMKAEAATYTLAGGGTCTFNAETRTISSVSEKCTATSPVINNLNIVVRNGSRITFTIAFQFKTVTVNDLSVLTLGQTSGDTTIENLNVNQAGNSSVVITYGTVNVSGDVRIYAGGIITHEALSAGTDFSTTDGSGNPLTASGRRKRVDLNITGTLTIDNGGSINVDNRGYPGENSSTTWGGVLPTRNCTSPNCGFGYGPGGGPGGGVHDTRRSYGSSASHGGFGGIGFNNNTTRQSPALYDVADPFTVEPGWLTGPNIYTNYLRHGSGGGMFILHDRSFLADGGRGGGIVRIRANDVLIANNGEISANGSGPPDSYILGNVGGSGSGGSILIQTSNIGQYIASVRPGAGGLQTEAAEWDGPSMGSGGSVLVNGTITQGLDVGSPGGANITAEGGFIQNGAAVGIYSSTGGGGRIFIITPSSATVQKTLEAVSRNGVAAVVGTSTDFNPYALQKGDKIRVRLTVAASGGTYNLTDIFLTGGGNSCRCGGTSGVACNATAPPAPTTTGTPPVSITWSGVSFATTPVLTYECAVQ